MKDKPRKATGKPLTDAQLAAKYDNGRPVDLVAALKKMVKGSSTTAKNKGR